MIVIEPPSSGTGAAGFPALRRPDLARFLKRAQKAAGLSGEVTVLLADDARLKELNRTFRRKNKPTDVLSFPAGENGEGIAGDLAISVETAAQQAAEHGHTLDEELRILMLHGILHLAGHDHEADEGEMRSLESDLRAKLKLPNGLIERTLNAPQKSKAFKRVTSLQNARQLVRAGNTPAAKKQTLNVSSSRRGSEVTTRTTRTPKKLAKEAGRTPIKKRSVG